MTQSYVISLKILDWTTSLCMNVSVLFV